MRQQKYRQHHHNDNDISNNINDHGVLAMSDKEEDERFNIEPNTNIVEYQHIEPKHKTYFHIEPNTDVSTSFHTEPITPKKQPTNMSPAEEPRKPR